MGALTMGEKRYRGLNEEVKARWCELYAPFNTVVLIPPRPLLACIARIPSTPRVGFTVLEKHQFVGAGDHDLP